MADEGDIAASWQQSQIEQALEARKRLIGESALECVECGEPIPDERRVAVPGVTLCVECQEEAER